MNDIPDFKPSAETELLCADLPDDAAGRVMGHLVRQGDVRAQQNSYILRVFTAHDKADAEVFKNDRLWKEAMEPKINEAHAAVVKVKSFTAALVGRKGIVTGIVIAAVSAVCIAVAVEKAKDWLKANVAAPHTSK